MFQPAEKRNFIRMTVDCTARFRVQGSEVLSRAIVKNLSGSGMLLSVEQDLEPGTRLAIEILPGKTVTPPLSALARVVRSQPDAQGNFSIACEIERVLQEHEVGPEFP